MSGIRGLCPDSQCKTPFTSPHGVMMIEESHRNLQRTDLKHESKAKIDVNDAPGAQVNAHKEFCLLISLCNPSV